MTQQSLPLATKKISAELSLPGSKSLSNRVLLIAAMAKGESLIENLPLSKDVLAAVDALKSLGINYQFDKVSGRILIQGANNVFANQKASVFCNEAGTLTRFIIPLCAAQNTGEYYIYSADRMMARPIAEQLKVLTSLGMKAHYEKKLDSLPMTILANGLNQQGTLHIDDTKSSQFLSGLLIAAPLISNGLKIYLTTDYPKPYVQMTVDMMRQFGVVVEVDQKFYKVIGNQTYQSQYYLIEPDISTSSYFWALAAITNGSVKVKHVTLNAKQGDICFLKVLEEMGCGVMVEHDGIRVVGSNVLKGVTVDMRHFSDTFMTVAAVACFAKGETHITGLKHTSLQESDRISTMAEGLTRLGVKVKITSDSIHICPQESTLQAAVVEGHSDHRIAMSLALIGLKQAGVIINGSECVSKTCPDYFERMAKII